MLSPPARAPVHVFDSRSRATVGYCTYSLVPLDVHLFYSRSRATVGWCTYSLETHPDESVCWGLRAEWGILSGLCLCKWAEWCSGLADRARRPQGGLSREGLATVMASCVAESTVRQK